MRLPQLLEHYGVTRNPFSEEDAQTDHVFKDHCIASTYHPSWDKVFGDPGDPATSVVFGEKGAGKTAIRLQIAKHLRQYNQDNPRRRALVIHYDDFNTFLGNFSNRLGRRGKRPDKVLAEWKLWDHIDSILSLGVTGLIDRVLEVKNPSTTVECDLNPTDIHTLDRHQARDLLLLATCYDQSTAEPFAVRWRKLCKVLRFRTWTNHWDLAVGMLGTIALLGLLGFQSFTAGFGWVAYWWVWLIAAVAVWLPRLWHMGRAWKRARSIHKRMRIGVREGHELRHALMQFPRGEMAGQPLPNRLSTDDRYELLAKFQGLIQNFGFTGIIVLLDRVDEPHLINGSADRMRALIWPLLDNKFLKHPGLGVKLMLPIELTRFIEREDRDFFQKARLDKQNMVSSFEWTGETLYDIAGARLRACAEPGRNPSLKDFFEDSLSQRQLIDSLRQLRTPRHLFKFLHRLLVNHCNSYTDETPVWKIPTSTFDSTLAVYVREQDAFDRGVGPG
jgi:hypothetical protein